MSTHQKSCESCRVRFSHARESTRFCSPKCRASFARHAQHKATYLNRECASCGSRFVISKADVDRAEAKGAMVGIYCSAACYLHRDRGTPDERACSRCGVVSPWTAEFFGKRASIRSKSKLQPVCKPCLAADARKSGPGYRLRLKTDVLSAYGNGRLACVCCGETHIEFLTLDHARGRGHGARERARIYQTTLFTKLRREGYPAGEYRTLCFNCNWAYGQHGTCPHQKTKRAHKAP